MNFLDKLLNKRRFPLIVSIIIALIIILIPLVLNTVIINNNFYSKSSNDGWAGFFGGYIGALISGAITLISVTWTIGEGRRIQEENNKDTEKRSVIPYLLFEENYNGLGQLDRRGNEDESKMMFYGGRELVNHGKGIARNIEIFIDSNEEKIKTPIININQKFGLKNEHKLEVGSTKDNYDLNIQYQNIYGDKYITKYILETVEDNGDMKFYVKELIISEVKDIED